MKSYLSTTSLAITLLLSVILFSCKKNDLQTASFEKMDAAAQILNGKAISAFLIIRQNERLLELDLNHDSKIIVVQKMPGSSLDIPSLQTASVITSDHGLVIHDAATGKIWLLAINDPKSLSVMESTRPLFPASGITAVFGTTIVNASN